MDTGRTERGPETEPESPLGGAAARKRAFVLAVALMVAAGGLIVLLAPDGEGAGEPGEDPGRERTVVMPAGEPHTAPALGAGDLRAARDVAKRFALAFLARESGRMNASARRVLRRISAPDLWHVLRQAPRATPAWQPPPARFERVSGIAETAFAGVVDVVVAYRVEEHRRYLPVRLSREGGRWIALPHGL